MVPTHPVRTAIGLRGILGSGVGMVTAQAVSPPLKNTVSCAAIFALISIICLAPLVIVYSTLGAPRDLPAGIGRGPPN